MHAAAWNAADKQRNMRNQNARVNVYYKAGTR